MSTTSTYTVEQYNSDIGSIYDELHKKAKASLDTALDEGKLVDSAYGSAMATIISEIIRTAVVAPLQYKDTELKQQQIDSNLFDKEAKKREEEIKLIDAQIDGTNRQTKGYDDHTKIELFKSQMNAYGILLSSGATDVTPEILQKSAVNDIYNNLLNGTNIAVVD